MRNYGMFSVPEEFNEFNEDGRKRETRADFENLGFSILWKDGKVYVHHHDTGETEVYNNFNELRVPDRTARNGKRKISAKPSAVYTEKNGVKYYLFPELGVTIKNCLFLWPEDSECQPPEHMFGPADYEEFAEALKLNIESGNLNPRAERAYRRYRERKWQRDLRWALERAKRALRRDTSRRSERPATEAGKRRYARHSVEFGGPGRKVKNTPVSEEILEGLEAAGFTVRIKEGSR